MSQVEETPAVTKNASAPKAPVLSLPKAVPTKIYNSLPHAIKPLGYRDYRLFWLASVVSNTGTWMYLAAIGWLTETTTDSPLRVSLVVTVGTLPLLVFSPLGGTLADRMSRVRLMVLTIIMQTIVAAALAVAVIADAAPYWVLIAFSLLNGCVASLGAPVQQAIIPELVSEKDLRNGVVMNSTQWNISRAVGPLAAGFIINVSSEGAVFVINTVSFVLMILVLGMMTAHPAPAPPNGASSSRTAEFIEAAQYARRNKGIIALLVSASILSIVLSPLNWLVPVIARDVFEAEAGGFGLLAGAFGIGSVMGGSVLLSIGSAVSSVRLVLVGYSGLAICVALLAGAPNLTFGVITISLCGFFFVFVSSSLITQLQTRAGDEFRGRLMSLWMMMFGAFMPLAVLIHGIIAEHVSMRWILLGDSVAIAVYLGAVWVRRALRLTNEL